MYNPTMNRIASNMLYATPTKNAAKCPINAPTIPNLHIPIIAISISNIPFNSTKYPLSLFVSFLFFFLAINTSCIVIL